MILLHKWNDCLHDVYKAREFETERRVATSKRKSNISRDISYNPYHYDISDDFFEDITRMHLFTSLDSFKVLVCHKVKDDLSKKMKGEKESKQVPYNWIVLYLLPTLRKINPFLLNHEKFRSIMHISNLFELYQISPSSEEKDILHDIETNIFNFLMDISLGDLAVYFIKYKDPTKLS